MPAGYAGIRGDIVDLLDAARRSVARSVNALMTASYWEVGRRIVEAEQQGRRRFFLAYPHPVISQTVSGRSARRPSARTRARAASASLAELAQAFVLPWSACVQLLSVKNLHARRFYEAEALPGGWSVRQLSRQISSQFYQRMALSKDRSTMLLKGAMARPGDAITPDDAIKDPHVLEFLDLKDEYSESDLEGALIQRLQAFLLELGGFTFLGRQRRLRIDQTWYRVDLLFFHRRLRSLVIIDLNLGALTHADVGQMHLYCNYAREHWTYSGEKPPVGLILCTDKGQAMAGYALEGLPTKVMAANYRVVLPGTDVLQNELARTRLLESSKSASHMARNKV